jgi:tetratricopeptide (TPR) repeat protein
LFVRAIEEKEDWPLPHFNLAVLHEERGEIQPALASYNRAIEIAPKYHRALFNLGRLMGNLGRVDRQQELWEAAIESNPKFVQGHYYLAKLLMDRGLDLGRAEELVRTGIAADPEHQEGPLGYFLLADILNRTGRSAEAQEAVRTGREIQTSMGR